MNSGTIVTFDTAELRLKHDDGSNGTQAVAPGATVTLNGKACKLADLKPGDKVTWSGEPATLLTVTRAGS